MRRSFSGGRARGCGGFSGNEKSSMRKISKKGSLWARRNFFYLPKTTEGFQEIFLADTVFLEDVKQNAQGMFWQNATEAPRIDSKSV